MDWTTVVWRVLCLLAIITALAVVFGPWWLLPPVWQAISLVPVVLVGLLAGVGSGCGTRS